MPIVETTALGYKASGLSMGATYPPFLLKRMSSRQLAPAVESQTQLFGLGAATAYNAQPSAMAKQTYSPTEFKSAALHEPRLDEALFDACATAKVLTSRVWMYLREGWREKLFHQLDNLLDPEEWDPDDKPLQRQSFENFLKAICDINPAAPPGIGLSYAGNLIAAWVGTDGNRLSLEFGPDGGVKLIGAEFINDEPLIFSAKVNVANLKAVLQKRNYAEWLDSNEARPVAA